MQERIENTEVTDIEYMQDWAEVRLGDVVEHVIDNRGKTPPLSDKGIVLLQSFSLVGDSKRPKLNDKVKYVDLNTYNSAFRAGHPIKGDIIIATNGNLGEFCIIDNEKLCIAQDVIGLRFNKEKVDETYMYYKLLTLESKTAIQNLNTGSTRPSVRVPHLLDYTFTIHKKVKTQQKIAQILSSLDDKIELNSAINKNLEEIAQTLFKQWFVDFEFPNENGEPYKSSGGEMVESELGLIPKGWREKVLFDMAEYINGTSFKSNEIYEDGIAIIKIAELKNGITSQTKYFKGDKDSKYLLKKRDILFSWSGSPETSIDIFIWDKDIESILNQHTFKVVPYKIQEYEFVHSTLKFFKKKFIEIAKNKQTTGLGHVTISDLKRLKISTPNDENIINQFKEKVENIYEKMMNIQTETQTLTKLRDELLPKLMSGEVRV